MHSGIFVQAHYSETKHAPDSVCWSPDDLWYDCAYGTLDLDVMRSWGLDLRQYDTLVKVKHMGSEKKYLENKKMFGPGIEPRSSHLYTCFVASCARMLTRYYNNNNMPYMKISD